MTLGEVAELKAGDVIMISNPQNSTVRAGSVPILAGRFGVHDGRYAVETTAWLGSKGDAPVTNK
jgi:flagellar motor switch protein FliM